MSVVLVTGAAGQVGHEVANFAWPEGVEIVAPERGRLDLADPATLKAFLGAAKVDAVINAAAYTAVDKAESEITAAFAGNALVPAALAEAASETGAALIHVSTDYVFDGSKDGAYEVDDQVRPLGVYGASKAAGELAVQAGAPRSAIVRTAWVVSARRANFVKTMLRYGQEREVIKVVDDQRGAPTLAADLAAALATVALRMIADRDAPTGLFHFSNAGPTTWHGFAAAIFEAARGKGLRTPRLEAIGTEDYPTPARRPKNSWLSTARIESDYGIAPRPWIDLLPSLIDDIQKASA